MKETEAHYGFELLFRRNVPHILEKIFFSLSYNSYLTCFEVNNAWKKTLVSERYQKGPFTYDVRKILGFSNPRPLITVSSRLSVRTSYMNGPQPIHPIFNLAPLFERRVLNLGPSRYYTF